MECKQGIIASFTVILAKNTVFCNPDFMEDNIPLKTVEHL